MVRVRFAGAVARKQWLDCALWLRRRVDHPRLRRIEAFGPDSYGCYFRLTRPDEIDKNLAALIREAYSVGQQKHVRA